MVKKETKLPRIKALLLIIITIALLFGMFFSVGFAGIYTTSTQFTRNTLEISISAVFVGLIFYFWAFFRNKESKKLITICLISGISFLLLFNGIIHIVNYSKNSILIVYDEIPLKNNYLTEVNNNIAKLNQKDELTFIYEIPTIDGINYLYPLYASFITNMTEKNVINIEDENSRVKCSGIIDSYRNLLDGKVDIIFNIDLQENELFVNEEIDNELLDKINLIKIPLTYDNLVFFVNSNNVINQLSIEEIKAIYNGSIKNFKKLGGKNQTIKPYQVLENSISQIAMYQFMNSNISLIEPIEEEVLNEHFKFIKQNARYRNYKNAIGYTLRRNFEINRMLYNDKVKDIGSFDKLSFYLIYLESNINPDVKVFVDYVLKHKSEILDKMNYLSID